ncbi:MAG: helix-turn-helix domain-containing protein [Deltaproteobacteria bacterium]|nr:helix-turn-helix domain-containing protein [Deltaproteobacteria bacterium]
MILGLDADLVAALKSQPVRDALEELVRRVVREELQAAPLLDQLLDAEQAAELLGMTRDAVLKAAQRGSLPAVRQGRRVRFRRSDLVGVRR